MAETNNTTCSICGKGYYLCLACKSHRTTPWKVLTDTAEHYKIHQVIKGYMSKVYTKDEANKKLKAIDLTGIEDFKPHIKAILYEIMSMPVAEAEKADAEETVDAEGKAEDKAVDNNMATNKVNDNKFMSHKKERYKGSGKY